MSGTIDSPLATNHTDQSNNTPSFDEVLRTFARIGVLSFGGPAAQIALMHRIIVDEKKWLDEAQYLSALSFCMLLPGPEAMQLATYAGWRLHGFKGGLAAGLLFVLPGALVVLALSIIYAMFGHVPLVEAVFFGIKAAVLVIVLEALQRVAMRALKSNEHWVIAAISFLSIFFLGVPFPAIVLAAAAFGYLLTSNKYQSTQPSLGSPGIRTADTVKQLAVGLVIWIAPLAAIAGVVGRDHILPQMSIFFSKLAVVTFGGAYAVLAYMGQDVVTRYGWLDAGQMIDGLGLAETTPGPLILVTEFVGFLAAYRSAADAPLLMGLAGAFVALWATFAPCFLWIFVGGPYIEWINAQPRLKGGLAAITAAVVGVILNLAVWFGLHVFFAKGAIVETWPLRLWVPEWSSLDLRAVALSAVSAILLLRLHWSIPAILAISAGAALLMTVATI